MDKHTINFSQKNEIVEKKIGVKLDRQTTSKAIAMRRFFEEKNDNKKKPEILTFLKEKLLNWMEENFIVRIMFLLSVQVTIKIFLKMSCISAKNM